MSKNYQNDLASMLRSIKCKNPKTLWNYLNIKTDPHKHDKQPDCENFANMFKNLGTSINNDDVNNEKAINFLRYMDINMYIRDYSIHSVVNHGL